jgi:DNA polymerase III subunit epsilon
MHHTSPFVAIDFEIADYQPDSACAVALVRVEGDCIVRRSHHLIRPPRQRFVFTYVHGITWEMVAMQPTFGELWSTLTVMWEKVAFLAAHNAAFERSVLRACCQAAGLEPPRLPFLCTMELARKTWNLFPTKLTDVCAHLNIPLEPHNLSDAEACARIVLAARTKSRHSSPGRRIDNFDDDP